MRWKQRARRLFESALITAVVCLVPPLLWAEWMTPSYGLRPPVPAWQVLVFKALVLPPGLVDQALGMQENWLGCLVEVSFCRGIAPSAPPLAAAWAFWRVGFPFWLCIVAGVGETFALARTRYTRANVRAGQS